MTDDQQTAPEPLPEKPPEKLIGMQRVLGRGIRNLVGHKVPIEEIHATLERYKGDRGATAEALNMDRTRLSMAINQNAMLKAKWGRYQMVGPGMKAVTGAQSRTPIPIGPPVPIDPNIPAALQSDAELAAFIAREDDRVKKGLTEIGLNDKEVKLAIELRNFHGRHIEKTVDMLTAGLSINSLRMLGVLRDLEKRMEEAAADPSKFLRDERGAPVDEAMVRTQYCALLEEYRRTCDLALRGTFMKAKIEMMAKAQQTKGKTGGRPGFKSKGEILEMAKVADVKQ